MGNKCKFIHVQKDVHEDGELKTLQNEAIPSQPDFNALLNKAPLMVFMKGNPANTLCASSQALIKILWDAKLCHDSYDVSSDVNVCQGLKKLSNCMTYPQVFVKGVFVGGLDTIKALKESGDLENKLKIQF